MDWYLSFGLLAGILVALMALRVPVAFAFVIANLVGVYVFMGGIGGFNQFILNMSRSVSSFYLVPVPLFIMMGEIFFHGGMSKRIFRAIDLLFGNIPGRLCYVAVVGGTAFSALSGSSMANAAMMGSLLYPQMLDKGYDPKFSVGPIISTGGLAVLVPPSALAVLLGSLAQINIGHLLLAGIMPAMLLALLYAAYIAVRIGFNPSLSPNYTVERIPLKPRVIIILRDLLPVALIVAFVAGAILTGIATPTESAAIGVAGVLVLSVIYEGVSIKAYVNAMRGTLIVSTMLLTILLSSLTFSQILAFSGATSGMIAWVMSFDLSPLVMLIVMFSLLMFLGMFVDQVSQMMLTLPIFMPIASSLGFDPVWFGIIMLIGLELSTMTPPFGLLLFTMLGFTSSDISIIDVSKAALPYLLITLGVVVLIYVFPSLVLWLPQLSG